MDTMNKKPNVYIERLPMESAPATGSGWGIAGFVGTAISGTTDKAVYVESFSAFADEFGKNSDSPYMPNSNLAYAVYDFFRCGGSACYIARAVGTNAAKATGTIGSESDTVTVTAKDHGAWANGLKVTISANEQNSTLFDMKIENGSDALFSITGMSNDPTSPECWQYISENPYVVLSGTALKAGNCTLSGGADSVANVTDANISTAINLLEPTDITWLAVPGETSSAVITAMQTFVNTTRAGEVFAVFDTPLNASVETLKTFAATLTTDMGAAFAPWGIVIDNLTGAKRNVPPSGAVLGNFSNSVRGRGIAKTPAGIESTCDSWIGVSKQYTDREQGILNSVNINCIVPQSGYGICIWGSRVCQENKKQNRKYISQSHIDIYMDRSLKELTKFTVFESINTALMEKTEPIVRAFMTEMFNAGCFVGDAVDEAFYVVCDWSNNTVDSDTFNIDVGYSKSKPNEFTVIRIKQYRASATTA